MFNPLLGTSLAVLLATIVHATGPGQSTAIVARNPYTNAEAFARGLPPLHPRRRQGCELACFATSTLNIR